MYRFLLATVLLAPALFADTPRCQVVGRVVDSAGLPIAGATVRLSSVGEPWNTELSAEELDVEIPGGHISKTTGSNGRFSFDLPTPTSSWVSLYITGAEYHGITGRSFGIAGGRNKEPLRPGKNELGDFVITSTGAISGRVTDVAGAPIANAVVSLSGSFPGGYAVNCRSAKDGSYLLGHVPEGSYKVTCRSSGFRSEHREEIIASAGVTTPSVHFILSGARSVSGSVVDPLGQPLANVWIWGWPTRSGTGAGARSGKDGRFTIALPQDDPYVLEATLQGYEKFEEGRASAGHLPGTSDVRIVLQPLPVIRFRVVDAETGAGIPDYGLIFKEAPDPKIEESQNANHADLKIYHFDDGATKWWAAPGKHDYLVQAPGYAPQRGPVRFDPGTADQQTIYLVRGGSVHGRLYFQEGPVTGSTVHLDRYPHDAMDAFTGRRRSVITDEFGRFEFSDLATGSYRLAIAHDHAAPYSGDRFDLFAPKVVDLGIVHLDPPATIVGQVLAKDGQSLNGITVFLGDPFDKVSRVTDTTGRFRFDGLSAGECEVRAQIRAPDRIAYTQPHRITTRAGTESRVTIDLRELAEPRSTTPPAPTGSLVVQVTVNDQPGAGFPAAAAHASDRWIHSWSRQQTDRDGLARFGGLHEGPHVVYIYSTIGLPLGRGHRDVTHEGNDSALDIHITTGELVVELPEGTTVPKGASVTLFVTEERPGRGPVLGGRVLVSKGGESPEFGRSDETVKITWRDRRYELGMIGTGRWIVEVGGDVLAYRKAVDVSAGKITVCDMTLDDVR